MDNNMKDVPIVFQEMLFTWVDRAPFLKTFVNGLSFKKSTKIKFIDIKLRGDKAPIVYYNVDKANSKDEEVSKKMIEIVSNELLHVMHSFIKRRLI